MPLGAESDHQSIASKEMGALAPTAANNLNELRSRFFSKASAENSAQPAREFSLVDTLSQVGLQPPDLGNHE